MIEKDKYEDELLIKFNEIIKEKMNFDLQFIVKELDQGYTKEEFIEHQIKSELSGVFTDLEAAEKLYKMYPYFICCNNELYAFNDKSGMYTLDENIIISIINRYKNDLHLLNYDKNGEVKLSIKSYGNTSYLKKNIIFELKSLCINNNWITESQFTSLGKLLFTNGYYDMYTGIFHNKFNPTIVFMYSIPYEFNNNNIDIEYMNDIKQRLIYNQLGNIVGDYVLLSLSRSIAGDRMKKVYFGLGDTNTGKSTLVNACINTFGDYIGTFNAENLSLRDNSSQDEAQQMRWSLLLRYKRIIFSNELKNNVNLNGNTLKKHSGGDTLIGRLHCKEEIQFVPHYTLFCYANDLPRIVPFDSAVNDRLNIITYSKRYVNDPSNEYELQRDDNINYEITTDKFKQTFLFLILQEYNKFISNGKNEIIPNEVKNNKDDWIGDNVEVNIVSKFLEEYTITNNTENYIESTDICA